MRMIVIYVENANTVHMKTQFTLSCLNEFKACCHLKFYGCSISAAQCEIFLTPKSLTLIVESCLIVGWLMLFFTKYIFALRVCDN